jgi:AcrR family transcriptional regulator
MAKLSATIQKADLREEILNAAREMFVREGYANVSMRKIAEKIGYSPTAIYLHFKDKNDLLHQICEESFARLARNIQAIQRLSLAPLQRLEMGMREYVEFGLQHQSHYEIIFISPIGGDYESGGYEDSNGQIAFETLTTSVRECAEQGLLKNNDVELISQVLWAGIHGITSVLIKHGGFPFVERKRLIDAMIETLIAGVKA